LKSLYPQSRNQYDDIDDMKARQCGVMQITIATRLMTTNAFANAARLCRNRNLAFATMPSAP